VQTDPEGEGVVAGVLGQDCAEEKRPLQRLASVDGAVARPQLAIALKSASVSC